MVYNLTKNLDGNPQNANRFRYVIFICCLITSEVSTMQRFIYGLLLVMLLSACGKKEPEAQVCGGITGKQCPAGQTCIDDPSDTCDPQKGGADCQGICK